MKNLLKNAALPLVIPIVFLSMWGVWLIFDLPTGDEMIALARHYFDLYGYWVVFVSAIIEGVLLAGWYFPGSVIIFLGVIFAGKNISDVILVVSLVIFGSFMAQLFNYGLGKYGWYRLLLKFGLKAPIEDAQKKLTKYGFRGIFLSYWHPNLAALASTAAGILHLSFKKFTAYSLAALIVWDAFWGGLVYVLGERAVEMISVRFIVGFILVWTLLSFIFKKKENIRND